LLSVKTPAIVASLPEPEVVGMAKSGGIFLSL
jgi:hypothetical protein